jgi:hypothetical protein
MFIILNFGIILQMKTLYKFNILMNGMKSSNIIEN